MLSTNLAVHWQQFAYFGQLFSSRAPQKLLQSRLFLQQRERERRVRKKNSLVALINFFNHLLSERINCLVLAPLIVNFLLAFGGASSVGLRKQNSLRRVALACYVHRGPWQRELLAQPDDLKCPESAVRLRLVALFSSAGEQYKVAMPEAN